MDDLESPKTTESGRSGARATRFNAHQTGGGETRDAPERPASEAGYVKLPWPLVAGLLAGVLLLALGVGLLANRAAREQVTLPTATAAPLLAAAPTAAPTRAPTVAPSPTPPPLTATALPVTATPAVPAAAPTVIPSPRPTVDAALADEVSAAYEHYWEVRAEALFNLNDSHLSEVMSGPHLAAAYDLINQLKADGRAIRTNLQHRYVVIEASQEYAKINDRYVSQSVYVDAESHEPLTEPTSETVNEQYTLENIDGTWRVTSLARAP